MTRIDWRRHRPAIGLGVVALLVLALAAPRFLHQMRAMRAETVDGGFELVDPSGKTVRAEDFRGKWMVVYFGYTHCPDSCPTALNDITAALDQIGNHRANVVPVFITVDPARDTPAAMGRYVSAFGRDFVALSGSAEAVARAERAFHVVVEKQPAPDGEYLMAHSSVITILDPDGDFAASFTHETDPKRIAATLLRLGA